MNNLIGSLFALLTVLVSSADCLVTGFSRCHGPISGRLPGNHLFLLAAKSKRSSGDTAMSPLIGFLGFGGGQKRLRVESTVDAALLLSNKKRQEEWKKDIKRQFPWVLPGVLDTCVDAMVGTFSSVAPSQLKAALKPGGIEKVRPKMEEAMVKSLLNSPPVKDIPLSDNDKATLIGYLVSLSLDYVLKDAQELMADPAVKLQALEVRKREIQRYMTFPELTWYRLRYFPFQTLAMCAFVTLAGYLLFQQYSDASFVKAASSIGATVWVTLSDVSSALISSVKRVMTNLSKLTSGRGKVKRVRTMRR